MYKLFSWLLCVAVLFVGMLSAALPSALADEMPLRVLIDVRSNHSDGAHDFNTLAALAKKRGIDVLAFTEHDRSSVLLGIEPIPKILGFQMQHPSLYTKGVEPFFADLSDIRQRRPDMLFMAGVESLPGIQWRGIIPRGDPDSPLLKLQENGVSFRYERGTLPPFALVLRDVEKHIISLGIERPEQINALPSFTLKHARGSFAMSMVFWWLVVGTMLIVLLKRRKRAVAFLLFASFIAFLASWTIRDAVDEDASYLRVARTQGLFTVWAHPGFMSGLRPEKMGIILDSPVYNERVFREPTADAFAALYGEFDNNTVPGGLWDRYMADYMAGMHAKPIWAVSSGDYHGEGSAGEYLGNFPMDVWAEKRSISGVLAAMHKGRIVAWRGRANQNFRVKKLYMEDSLGKLFLPGDEATVSSDLKLLFQIHEWPDSGRFGLADKPIRARIIVDGEVLKSVQMRLNEPIKVRLHLTPGAHVVRMDIPMQWLGQMVANPFLLRVAN